MGYLVILSCDCDFFKFGDWFIFWCFCFYGKGMVCLVLVIVVWLCYIIYGLMMVLYELDFCFSFYVCGDYVCGDFYVGFCGYVDILWCLVV